MNISWHGLSSFEITTKTPAGEVTLVTDPYVNETGLRFPRTLTADLVAVSHDEADANNTEAIQGKPFVVNTPGEYEVKGVFVYSISAPLAEKGMEDHRIFRFEIEGVHLAHLGALNRVLTDDELAELKNIDILMIPAGGGRVLSPKLASEVIEQLEPRVVIPMTHSVEGLKENLGTADAFCKALGVCQRETTNKYKVTKRDLPEEDMLIMTLERA
ncbi:MAG: MBL fold metallo-hydrolase [Patescibacteria group bacterium]|jgi:L-ascorbate metabolism protein UlaG (beta-lactamase superfamily)